MKKCLANPYEEGFIMLRRNLLSQPEIMNLINEEGWAGVGIYVAVNLYLSHCEGGWGAYTGRQLSAIAVNGKKHRGDVTRVIENYGLFVIEGSRFTSHWMLCQHGVDDEKLRHTRASKTRAGEIEQDIEKENKEKGSACVCHKDTQPESVIRPPLAPPTQEGNIGPSAYESVDRDGLRHAKGGELVPWWAPPQTDVYARWSMLKQRWIPLGDYDAKAEQERRNDMTPEDFMMKTAWEKLDETEHNRILDDARRQ